MEEKDEKWRGRRVIALNSICRESVAKRNELTLDQSAKTVDSPIIWIQK